MHNTVNVPLPTVFNTGLNYINPNNPPKKLFCNRTHHTAGMAALGAEMLGYDSTFCKWGLAGYNSVIGEQYTGGMGYPLVPNVIDNDAPTIVSGPTVTAGGSGSLDISLATDEPATTLVRYGTTSGGPYTHELNDTILNASSTVSLTGLTPGNTYYAVVTACDGLANCTTSSEFSWGSPPPVGKPDLAPWKPAAYWADLAAYTAGDLTVDFPVFNAGSNGAYNMKITGSDSASNIPMTTPMPVAVGDIGPGGTGHALLNYAIPAGTYGFMVNITASAEDGVGNLYSYP